MQTLDIARRIIGTYESLGGPRGHLRSWLAVWVGSSRLPRTPSESTEPPVEQADEPTRITVDVTRVNMLFTVTDKKGRFVTDLDKGRFRSHRKQEAAGDPGVHRRERPAAAPRHPDRHQQQHPRPLQFEQEAASEFIKSVIKAKQDKAMVVSFDTSPELVADLMDDTDNSSKAIRGLRPGGGTALYDAIYFACRDKLQQDQPRHKFRRAIVILSDGDDNQSRYTRDQALEMAQKADVVIYAISTNISPHRIRRRQGPEVPHRGDRRPRVLPVQGGGPGAVLREYRQRAAPPVQHLYRPEPLITDGLFHPIELRVKGRKDLVVHARKGYYATKM